MVSMDIEREKGSAHGLGGRWAREKEEGDAELEIRT